LITISTKQGKIWEAAKKYKKIPSNQKLKTTNVRGKLHKFNKSCVRRLKKIDNNYQLKGIFIERL